MYLVPGSILASLALAELMVDGDRLRSGQEYQPRHAFRHTVLQISRDTKAALLTL
jgi:hypothetical protein